MLNISLTQAKTLNKNLSTPSLAERISLILSSRQPLLKPRERFLLEYVQLVVYFRLAIMGQRETAFALSKALDLKEGKGKRFGFLREELRCLNMFVRERYQTEWRLNEISTAITARLGGQEN